jgi:ApaG protein
MIKMSAISINVKTQYIETQSVPTEHKYVYAYTITIANQGEVPAQLVSRHWRITDANEKLQEVQGLGVVGEQPHLKPGESYTYTSGVILETETGIMEGTYQMRTDEGTMFDAFIPTFALVPPYAIH